MVDENIGYPTGDPIPGYDAVSSDPGLNDIFEAYQATAYYPGYNYIPQWDNRTHFILCDGCDINAFEQALIDYSSVVENTIQCQPYTMNALYVKLITLNNGTNTGNTTPDGVVITDNDDLNRIYILLCANRLSLNVNETEFINFRPPRSKILNRFTLKLNHTFLQESP